MPAPSIIRAFRAVGVGHFVKPPIHMLLSALMILTLSTFAHAEMVSIKWKPSQPVAWVPGNNYIDGHTFNFINDTIEEEGKIKRDGELQAELMVPKGIKVPIPFVLIMHGCSGMNVTLKKWAHEYGRKLVEAGYGVLILDSFTTRGVGPEGICSDFSQLEWARRRADDAYAALDWLIEKRQGRSQASLRTWAQQRCHHFSHYHEQENWRRPKDFVRRGVFNAAFMSLHEERRVLRTCLFVPRRTRHGR
jgi:hypothetical protein